MSSPPPVELFKGTSWEECHKFILAIRARALWEGKQRDSAWKADFAGTLFWHKALLWHSRLPDDVCEDWSKLQIALLERWPPPDDDDEPQITPTPAAAPSTDLNDKTNHPLQGVLKVVLDESNTTYYVQFDDTICNLTTNASEAISVRCHSVPGATLLERTNNPSHSWLAVHWCYSTPKIEKGSNQYGRVSLVNPVSLKSSRISTSPFQLMSCTVLNNGEVVPVWTKDDMSKTTLFVMHYGTSLNLVADPEAYNRTISSAKRGKFFIEPAD